MEKIGSEKLFLRKASGLVRAWSWYDMFIYNSLPQCFVTMYYTVSLAVFLPSGDLTLGTVISVIFMYVMVGFYAMLVTVMPRAGGDYVWQSRVLGGVWGYVLCLTGWVVILFMWTPIFGQFYVYSGISPTLVVLSDMLKNPTLIDTALWFNTRTGIFWTSIVISLQWFAMIALGMRTYARIQRLCFFIGTISLAACALVLATGTQSKFVSLYDSSLAPLFTYTYQDTIQQATQLGMTAKPTLNIGDTFFYLVPLLLFWVVYPNWGAPLYGEVRGAGSLKTAFASMAWANTYTLVTGLIFIPLALRAFGWEFLYSSSYLYWNGVLPIFPWPTFLATVLTNNLALRLFMQIAAHTYMWAWGPCVFLSSTRVLFAMSFDRVLPNWVGKVTTRFKSPINCLIIMFVGSAIVTWLYCFTPFWRATLDAMIVILVTYVFTAIAGMILPYTKKDLFEGTPPAKFKIAGVPLLTILSAIFLVFGIFSIIRFATDSNYFVNDPISALFMLGIYVGSIILFYSFKWYRKKTEGIDISLLYKEIPVE